jgi:transposase-like protein
MVDGVHFAEHLVVVAMGIGIDGTKHPLAPAEGSTENATLVTDLLVGLRERGLDVTRPLPVVIDGSKALSSAVRAVFDHPVIARRQLHKVRNVTSKLPEALGSTVAKKMRAAYNKDALAALAELEELARQLSKSHPGAAGSLREGLAETLTVNRLGVPPLWPAPFARPTRSSR